MTVRSFLGNTRRADISFFSSGRIDITARIANALSLKKGDTIDILTSGVEFYLYISARAQELYGRHEAQCNPTKSGSRHFRTYSRRLCQIMLSECKALSRANLAAGSIIDVNGKKAIHLITRNNIVHD